MLDVPSGRIVGRRLTTAPGPDPVAPAARLPSFVCASGHPVADSTRVCADQFGGGPTDDRRRRRTRSRTHDRPVLTSSRHIATFPSLHAKKSRAELRAPYALYAPNHACRPKWLRLRDRKWLCLLARYHTSTIGSLRRSIRFTSIHRPDIRALLPGATK